MKLTPSEITSPAWQKVETYYRPLLDKYRARLENTRTPDTERSELCWKIDGIKKLLAMAEATQGTEADAS